MFLIKLMRWLFGWVKLEAEGGFPERLLNLTAMEGIELWGVCRQGVKLTACCPVRQYKKLRQPARRTGMRIHVTKRYGLPFLIRRYRSRAGAAIGLAAFLLVLHLFSQRVWVVEVRGNKESDSVEILEVMKQFGVKVGADLSTLDIDTLQLEALKKLPHLAWCVVNIQGSIAYIDVTERIPTPDLSNADVPSNIKAKCDGRIESVEVYTGQAMVQKGDAVAKGMLLVSGVVESKVGPILRRSQARILARTNRSLEVKVPLKEVHMKPSGHELLRPSLRLFTLDIPMYTDGEIEQPNKLTVSRMMLDVNGIELPVGIIQRRYDILSPVEIERTEQQAEQLAKQRLEKKKSDDLSSVQIVSSSQNGKIQDGQYIFKGEYTCIEDICMEEQIIIDRT